VTTLVFRVFRVIIAKFQREANSHRNVQSVQIPDFSNLAGFRKL
jgi:hypothetical protein